MDTVSVDRFGRVVIPKPVRDQLGLDAGAELTVEVVGDAVHLVPVSDSDRIETRDGLVDFTGEVLDQIRSGRGA